MNPLVQPLILGYQERAQKQQQELQVLQAHAKKLTNEYSKVVQQLHENEIVKKVKSASARIWTTSRKRPKFINS